jgi:hypothetical protein
MHSIIYDIATKEETKVILSADEEAVLLAQWEDIETEKAEIKRIQAIKDETRARIIALIPGGTIHNYLEKENHLHAIYSELQDVIIDGGALTTEQATEKTFLKDTFHKMDDMIAMSNLAESNGDTIETYIADLDAKGY